MKDALKKLDWNAVLDYIKLELSSKFVLEHEDLFFPATDYSKAVELQNKTKFFWEMLERGEDLPLSALISLRILFEKALKRGLFLPVELKSLKDWFVALRKLKPVLKRGSLFSNLLENFYLVEGLETELDRVFDSEKVDIRDRASYSLFVIRKKIREAEDLLFTKLENIKEYYWKKGYLQDAIFTQRNGRYVFPVKIEYKNKVKGILHELSQSGATAFIEPVGIIGLTNELEELRYREQREISKILRELSQVFFEKKRIFYLIERGYAEVEVCVAKAKFGRSYRGVFPRLKQRGEVVIKGGFHPVLFFEAREKGKKVVSNDYILDRGLLITGPNLGGKTVSLKTIGLTVLLAQAGFPVPAKEAEVCVFKSVFVDLGDEQSILEGESSFSSHLKNLKNIWQKADESSLVLLDEPGKGTNPEEGAALVGAIIEELLEKGAKLVITTHSQFLKTLALKLPGLKIATMEYDSTTREPTYRLIYGVWGESFAFELARKLGFPERVLNRAESYLKDKSYWEWTRVLEKEVQKVKSLENSLKAQLEEVQRKKQKLKEEEEALKQKHLKLVNQLVTQWNQRFQEFLKECSKGRKSEKKVIEKFDELVEQVVEEFGEELNEELKVGDEVEVLSLNAKGKIINIKNDVAKVQIGSLTLDVPVKTLKKSKSSPSKQSSSKHIPSPQSSPSFLRVKLIGLTVDEALTEVERVINEAFLSGVKRVYFIHGHGTGRLREAVRDYLKTHPLVKGFEFAKEYEGGTGVTIAYIEEKN